MRKGSWADDGMVAGGEVEAVPATAHSSVSHGERISGECGGVLLHTRTQVHSWTPGNIWA